MKTNVGLLALLVVLLNATPAATNSGFMLTCSDIELIEFSNAVYLAATCLNDDQEEGETVIDLNSCILNNNGYMGCLENGGFYETCGDFELTVGTNTANFFAYCLNDDEEIIASALNLGIASLLSSDVIQTMF